MHQILRLTLSGPDRNGLTTTFIGDGANDPPMLRIAGLEVAFHARPVVQ